MGGAMSASLETTLAIELFLNDNYLFRHNVLNGKVEFSAKSADDEPDFRPLTQEALNSIIRRAKKEQVCEKGSPKTEIMEFVHSEHWRLSGASAQMGRTEPYRQALQPSAWHHF